MPGNGNWKDCQPLKRNDGSQLIRVNAKFSEFCRKPGGCSFCSGRGCNCLLGAFRFLLGAFRFLLSMLTQT